MIEQIILTLVLLQVGVVVAVFKSILAGILEVIILIYPAIRVKRGLSGHVGHAALRRRRYAVDVPPVSVARPVVVVSVDIGSVDVVQLACLEIEFRWDFHNVAVDAHHIVAELNYARAAVAASESQPSGAVVVDAYARVKRGTAPVKSRRVAVQKGFPERV